jgi:hypothetical protein
MLGLILSLGFSLQVTFQRSLYKREGFPQLWKYQLIAEQVQTILLLIVKSPSLFFDPSNSSATVNNLFRFQ